MKNLAILTWSASLILVALWVYRAVAFNGQVDKHTDSAAPRSATGSLNEVPAHFAPKVQLVESTAEKTELRKDREDGQTEKDETAARDGAPQRDTDASKPANVPGHAQAADDGEKEAGATIPVESMTSVEALAKARKKLTRYKSVQAKVLETVAIGSRKFKVHGSYLQGTDLRIRLEFDVEIAGRSGSLLEVCDGQVLWTRHTIGSDTRITRRDVRKILNAAAESKNVRENMLVAELGMGGLPGLLASLERSMQFEENISEHVVDEHKFIAVEGTWNEKFSEKWKRGSGNSEDQLPDYVPDRVRVYLDADNFFPRRILYEKKQRTREIYRPMVTLDLANVVLDASIDDNKFYFVPPDDVTPNEVTEQYLQKLVPANESNPETP